MALHGWPEEARELFERGYEAQAAGHFDEAVECYRRSLAIHPSAEAHTFIGWTFSQQGKHEEAIEECRKAIAVDPTFGNPYNDIGAYLIALGREDDAIEWLERAKTAPRYEPGSMPVSTRCARRSTSSRASSPSSPSTRERARSCTA
jgi:tetratricopeptide (TPR) repeat protein